MNRDDGCESKAAPNRSSRVWIPVIEGRRWDERTRSSGESGTESGMGHEQDPQCAALDRTVLEHEPKMSAKEACARYAAIEASGSVRAGLTRWELQTSMTTGATRTECEAWESALRQLAESGDASAQMCLGRRAEAGLGIALDIEDARHWYQMSATRNDPWGRERCLGLDARVGTITQRNRALEALVGCVNANHAIDTVRLLAEVLWEGDESGWDAGLALMARCFREGGAAHDGDRWVQWGVAREGIEVSAGRWLAVAGQGDARTGYRLAGDLLRNASNTKLGPDAAVELAARIAHRAFANDQGARGDGRV